MTVLLVFPPRAAPTYVPLGLATLAGHVRAQGLNLQCLDLNQTAHGLLAGDDVPWADLMSHEAAFADEAAYSLAWGQVSVVTSRLAALERQALEYLDTGRLGAAVGRLLADQVRRVLSVSPGVVGLSVLYPSQVPFALALARALRDSELIEPSLPRPVDLQIVLGGASLSALHVDDLLLASPFIDGAVLKEGEAALEHLCRGETIVTAPGARFVRSGQIVQLPLPDPVCLEEAEPPDFSDFDLRGYLCPTPVLPALFSRDCRYRRCRFCAHNFSSAGYRRSTPRHFVDGLARTSAATGARHFYLADQYIEAEDLEAISQHILDRGLDLRWSVMARTQPGFTDEVLATLRRAGCVWISWGLESGSQRLLDIAGKGVSVAVGEDVLRRAARAGISNLAMMIFGLPGSDDEAFEQTAQLLERLSTSLDAATQSSFVLFEGTPFARRAEHFGLIVKGHQEFVRIDGRPVRSRRLDFAEIGTDGTARPPRGAIDIAAWNKRRMYTCPPGFFDNLVAEHYLLIAARRGRKQHRPRRRPTRAA